MYFCNLSCSVILAFLIIGSLQWWQMKDPPFLVIFRVSYIFALDMGSTMGVNRETGSFPQFSFFSVMNSLSWSALKCLELVCLIHFSNINKQGMLSVLKRKCLIESMFCKTCLNFYTILICCESDLLQWASSIFKQPFDSGMRCVYEQWPDVNCSNITCFRFSNHNNDSSIVAYLLATSACLPTIKY